MTDWIEWHGGEQPVADDVVVEFRTQDGRKRAAFSHDLIWGRIVGGQGIIAYRIVSQDSELDRLRAELEALKTDIATYVRISSEQATENEGLRAENAAIRVQWGMCYSQGMAYIDDGECSDGRTIPVIDFKRDSVEQIQSKMRERAINAMKGK